MWALPLHCNDGFICAVSKVIYFCWRFYLFFLAFHWKLIFQFLDIISENTWSFLSDFAFAFCVPYTVHPECADVAAGSGHAGDLTPAVMMELMEDVLTPAVMVSHLDSCGRLEEEFDCSRA